MKKRSWIAAAFASAVLLVGCGSNSKSDITDLPDSKETGISIEYVSSEYVPGKGLVNSYKIHIADQNGNPLSLPVAISVINGVKVMGSNGVIHATQPVTFEDPSISFADVRTGDKLIIAPSSATSDPTYLGDWTVAKAGSTLTLYEGAYYLSDTDRLSYIIGNEKRLLGRDVGVVHVERDANTTTNEAGYVYFNIVSDVILAGHTITIGAHTTSGTRLGAMLVDSVRGASYVASPVEVPVDGNSHTVYMTLWIDPAGNGTGVEKLINLHINPSSFTATDGCTIDSGQSLFYTNEFGTVMLRVNTYVDVNATTNGTCTIEWKGDASNIYMEY